VDNAENFSREFIPRGIRQHDIRENQIIRLSSHVFERGSAAVRPIHFVPQFR